MCFSIYSITVIWCCNPLNKTIIYGLIRRYSEYIIVVIYGLISKYPQETGINQTTHKRYAVPVDRRKKIIPTSVELQESPPSIFLHPIRCLQLPHSCELSHQTGFFSPDMGRCELSPFHRGVPLALLQSTSRGLVADAGGWCWWHPKCRWKMYLTRIDSRPADRDPGRASGRAPEEANLGEVATFKRRATDNHNLVKCPTTSPSATIERITRITSCHHNAPNASRKSCRNPLLNNSHHRGESMSHCVPMPSKSHFLQKAKAPLR